MGLYINTCKFIFFLLAVSFLFSVCPICFQTNYKVRVSLEILLLDYGNISILKKAYIYA